MMRLWLFVVVVALCYVPRPAEGGEDSAGWVCANEGMGIDEAQALAQWPRSCMDLKFWQDTSALKGMEQVEFRAAAERSLANCSAVSGLRIAFAERRDEANVFMKGQAMRGSILAFCYFPNDDCGDVVGCRFNANVNWSPELFADTLTHELGHGFGLPHTNDRRDIMFPTIIGGRKLDASYGPHYSIPQLVARYGDVRPPGPPKPPSDPPVRPGIDWQRLVMEVVAAIIAVLTGYFSRGWISRRRENPGVDSGGWPSR